MYLAFCSIIFNIRLSSVCLMINVFDRKLTFSFLNTSVGFLRLRPQIHTSSFSSFLSKFLLQYALAYKYNNLECDYYISNIHIIIK